jgi:phospholipid/cholesterol/gamma-HCH transport system substrate-binding protein
MRPFRDRNPTVIGAAGLAVIAVLMLGAFQIENLPLVGGGTTYRAAFRDASGLAPDNEVRVAGVKVGTVTDVGLASNAAGPYVRVQFRIDGDVRLGSNSEAEIRIKTILGQKYLSLTPVGPGRLTEGAEIPVGNTRSPFDVIQAFKGLAKEVEQIDTARLAESFTALSAAFAQTPAGVRTSLASLATVSQAMAARDEQLRTLLTHARAVSAVLVERDDQLRALIRDADVLLQELSRRRGAIHRLLESTNQLAVQLSGVVSDNRAKLEPALNQLRGVLATLQRHRDDLDHTLRSLGPFLSKISTASGNGRWVEVYVRLIA